MNMAWNREEIINYIKDSRSLVLATVDENGFAQLRSIGGYGADGLQVYFGTAKTSGKVKQIEQNPHVALLFQHEGQQVPKNVTLYGTAAVLGEEEFESGAAVIRERRPQIAFQKEESNLYRVDVEKVKILDFGSETKIKEVRAEELRRTTDSGGSK
ncbi:MAG: pyridoxamine 5'-phosphate oxidase family protein [Clostridiales bacterium]|nr:pyridoxamine 5'-phosphate oxidase family protein [Clostridiales bacterium]